VKTKKTGNVRGTRIQEGVWNKNINLHVKAAQRELKSCEQHLADIREIMILKEAKLNQLKAKRIQIENNLPSLLEKAAIGKIFSDQLEQAKAELKDLKRQLFEIPILLKGLKSEEPQYIDRISKAKQTIDIDSVK
jgi:chromosome segregation ATPase